MNIKITIFIIMSAIIITACAHTGNITDSRLKIDQILESNSSEVIDGNLCEVHPDTSMNFDAFKLGLIEEGSNDKKIEGNT